MFFVFALSIVSSTSFARSEWCLAKDGEMGHDYKHCKKGDMIKTVNFGYCDLNKTITKIKQVRRGEFIYHWFVCAYVGYERKTRK